MSVMSGACWSVACWLPGLADKRKQERERASLPDPGTTEHSTARFGLAPLTGLVATSR